MSPNFGDNERRRTLCNLRVTNLASNAVASTFHGDLSRIKTFSPLAWQNKPFIILYAVVVTTKHLAN